ncbi:RHS repeat-associated core domain-containing protein [Pseudomonas putida]|uniref:RHS repeat-associated core domain-containing protein n=1 Tax=Pseudomonas putida TaxID=303 RepID=UPI00215EA07D|nr:RHS repeat-associated core domain-containing protein [Pseudomonas putida]UVL76254.1 RHS repeat-associated core domain-containing protein [Pseudomonas putida]
MKLFYCAGKVHTLKSEGSARQVIRHDRDVLIERGAVTHMAWGDKQASVLGAMGPAGVHGKSYGVYGVHEESAELASVIGFSGYYFDALSTHYLLGNGYRSYSPSMMRFLSPDSLSPFSRGGLNAYGYCAGDPLNRVDPDGRFWESALTLKRVKIKVKDSSSGVRRFMKARTGLARPDIQIADFTAAFKDTFDATPSRKLNFDEMTRVGGIPKVKPMVLYRSMKNAKRAYMALAVNEMDIDSRGMFPQHESQVTRMLERLRDARDFSISFQEHDRGFQRAHAKNMTEIDGWLEGMRKERDASAIQLAERLRRQE